MHKPSMLSLVLGLVFSFSVLNAQVAVEAQQDQTDLAEALVGKWSVVSLQMGPNPAPEAVVAKSSFAITAENLTIIGMGTNDTVCEYVIDTEQTPNTIKFKPAEETSWVAGIVKIQEDGNVIMCITPLDEAEMPTAFTTGEETPKHMLVVLKKAETE